MGGGGGGGGGWCALIDAAGPVCVVLKCCLVGFHLLLLSSADMEFWEAEKTMKVLLEKSYFRAAGVASPGGVPSDEEDVSTMQWPATLKAMLGGSNPLDFGNYQLPCDPPPPPPPPHTHTQKMVLVCV